MVKKKFSILAVMGIFMLVACNSAEKGDNMVLGGLTKIDITDERAKNAHELIKKDLYMKNSKITLDKIEEAFVQVVSGYNTYVICGYTEKGKTGTQKLRGKVYTDLGGKSSVSEIEMPYKP